MHPELTNHGESKNFFRTAVAWQGSVTPRVLPRLLVTLIYAWFVVAIATVSPHVQVPITPFEYSGAVLGLLLVLRMNSGVDRWWEARKIWGSIVNQSRNLAIIATEYSSASREELAEFRKWVAAWPHVMRESLRGERALVEVERLLGPKEAAAIRAAPHMPGYVGLRIAGWLRQLRTKGLDDFAFQRAERERALLIDAIGACERIRFTPMPFVLAVKTRRFILLFLLLLPIALVERTAWLTPLVVLLAAYPLFSLDEIGAELQNPFSPRNLSHLPLGAVCNTIEGNVLAMEPTSSVGVN